MMRTAVVLPAPFGPKQPQHGPGGRLEIDARQGLHVFEGFS